MMAKTMHAECFERIGLDAPALSQVLYCFVCFEQLLFFHVYLSLFVIRRNVMMKLYHSVFSFAREKGGKFLPPFCLETAKYSKIMIDAYFRGQRLRCG